jgi:UDP-2,3-diacylglucosamine hydrolase
MQDEKYLKYRKIIRNPFIKPIGNIVPAQVWEYLGNRASKKSRARTSDYANRNTDQLIQMIRNHALKVYPEKAFDVIISGHMHVFDDHKMEINGQPVRSINLGSWYEPKVRIFRMKNGIGEWVYLPDAQ